MSDEIVVSTDGSALGNPNGPMGWAWADHTKDAGDGGAPGHEHDAHGYGAGGATNGTNQIGELCAVLEALRAHPGPQPLLIESDSQYAINCSTTWVKGWKRNGWRNAAKKPVKNVEIIKAIDAEMSRRPGPVRFRWVKGHAGNAGNELVDELARTYAGDCRSGARDGLLPIEGWQSLIASEYAQGLDVPPDVQLILEGNVSADKAAVAGGSVSSTAESRCDVSDDATVAGSDSRPASDAAAPASKPSLAELLAEPEGVPDYPDSRETREAKEPKEPETMRIRSDGDPGDPADDVDRTETSESVARGTAQDEVPPIREELDAHGNVDSAGPDADVSRPTSTASLASAHTTQGPRPTGLTVSGNLVFSPAPRTSPTFTGKPVHVAGLIEVEGMVDGDGNLALTNARFLRP